MESMTGGGLYGIDCLVCGPILSRSLKSESKTMEKKESESSAVNGSESQRLILLDILLWSC